MSDTLFQLVSEYQQIYDLITDEEVDPQVVNDTLEGIMGAIEVKAEGCLAVLNRLEMERDACKKHRDDWAVKYERRDNGIKNMKNMIVEAMTRLGKTELKVGDSVFKVVGNGGKQPMDVDKESVPDSYLKVIYEPDNEKIRKDLESGKKLKFAKLLPRGKHLKY